MNTFVIEVQIKQCRTYRPGAININYDIYRHLAGLWQLHKDFWADLFCWPFCFGYICWSCEFIERQQTNNIEPKLDPYSFSFNKLIMFIEVYKVCTEATVKKIILGNFDFFMIFMSNWAQPLQIGANLKCFIHVAFCNVNIYSHKNNQLIKICFLLM